VRTLIGLTATLAGITWLVQRGLHAPDTPWPLSLLGIGVLFGGLAALGALRLLPSVSESADIKARDAEVRRMEIGGDRVVSRRDREKLARKR
jgi:hypothetical protein